MIIKLSIIESNPTLPRDGTDLSPASCLIVERTPTLLRSGTNLPFLNLRNLMLSNAFPILKKYFDPDRGVELFAANKS